ncbi:GDSL-type esterase/lipase family protein [Nitrincola sp. A-D6]|uniref:GDSL-type esterase/lipase family protein n=1 Tax=Nitrincola sp. A-D6 TaxID=1545442 RepID=UPI00068E1AA2|nr:GDSL-type esterase/lipase family protein [Nitrincola sp. A-D6]
MKKLLFSLYILALHLAFIFIIINTNFIEKIINKVSTNKLSMEVTFSPYYFRTLNQHLAMDAQHPEGINLFIGDSFIQGLSTAAILSPSANYGISADTTYGLLNRLKKYKSIEKSDKIIISIGINDILSGNKDQEIINNYKKIIEQLLNHKSIFINSIFPVSINTDPNGLLNSRIDLLNSKIELLTKGKVNINYINIKDHIRNSDAYLSGNFYIEDGLHLSVDGYNEWIEILKNYIYP